MKIKHIKTALTGIFLANCILAGTAYATSKPHYQSNELLVTYKSEISKNIQARQNSLKKWGVKVKQRALHTGVDLLEIPAGETVETMSARLASDPSIEHVQPNYIYQKQESSSWSTDPYTTDQWGLHNTGQTIEGINGILDIDINLPEAHEISKGSSDIIVAIIDGGLDTTHTELRNAVWKNSNEIPNNNVDDDGNGYVDDVEGWDFYHDDASVYDRTEDDEHATHIAGVIAAAQNGAGITGIAPHVKIMPLKFIGPDGGTTMDAIRAIEYATENGARVLNNSWGFRPVPFQKDYPLEDAITASGLLFVGAAGNDGLNRDRYPDIPCGLDSSNIITVAAINNRGELANFSAYGANRVDIGAPGASILSTLPGGRYGMMDGTSMAAPFVSGTAALMLSANPSLSAEELINVLMSTARKMPSLSNKTVSGGMVDAYATLQAVQPDLTPDTSKYTLLSDSDMTHILHTKAWTVTLSAPLAAETATPAHVRVVDEHGRTVPVTIELESPRKLIIQPIDSWKPHTLYYVFLEGNIRSTFGKTLKPGYFTFTTE